MSGNKLIVVVLLVAALLLVSTLVLLEGSNRTMVIDIAPMAGSKLDIEIEGEVEVDGVIKPVKEMLPTKLTYHARQVAFAFIATSEDQIAGMHVQICVDGLQETTVAGRKVGGYIHKPRLVRMSRFPPTGTFTFSTGKVADLGQ